MELTRDRCRHMQRRAAFLAFIGLLLSLISLVHFTQRYFGVQTGPSFCNLSEHFNCDAVTASAWSTVFGVPLASYGIFFYFCVLVFSLFAGQAARLSVNGIRQVLAVVSILATILSVFLFFISEFVIGALCLVCMGIYLVNILLFVVVWRAPREGSLGADFLAGCKLLLMFPISVLGLGAKLSLAERLASVIYLLSGAMLAVVIYFLPIVILVLQPPGKNTLENDPASVADRWAKAETREIELNLNGGLDGDYQEGPANAPVTLIEFSDFQCPACHGFYATLREALREFSGQVRVIHKNYPLDNECNESIKDKYHEYACYTAYLARCAGEQGRFWEAADLLFSYDGFENGKGDQIHSELLSLFVEKGMDGEALKECIQSGRQKKKIVADIKQGLALKLGGTPSIFINGRKIDSSGGEALREVFRRIITSPQK